jgi:methyl-accepting chemotaxis protein
MVVENIDNVYQIVNSQNEALNDTMTAFQRIKQFAEEIVSRTSISDAALKSLIKMSDEIDRKARKMAIASEGSAASTEEIAATSQQQLISVEMIERSSQELAKVAEQLL